MPGLRIDNLPVSVEHGATILDAARKIGVEIPTMCFQGGHPAAGSCMVCVVKVQGISKFLPACAMRAEDGMVVETRSEEVLDARRTALELLFGDHLGDCVGPCQSGCPAHMDIPTMIRRIAERRHRDAIVTVKQHIALPAVLGHICPEICEKGCRRAFQDAPVSICLLKRFVADIDLASEEPYLPDCKRASGKRVAIVGAGPAGLAAAYYLQQEGHACALFDDHPLPGGMLRYGVPVERLPHEALDAEIDSIRRLGAEFQLSTRVGSIPDLRRDFDAVLVATGQLDKEATENLGLPKLQVDRATMMTSTPGVFTAGSAITHSHFAVRAVADGRSAAVAISRYLAGEPVAGAKNPYSVHIGRLAEGEISVFMVGVSKLGRVAPSGDGFDEEEACRESLRCLHCECGKLYGCKLRDYGIEYRANPNKYRGERQHSTRELTHPYVIYESGKCISCGLCVQITSEAGEPLGLTFIGRGFNVRPGVPFNEPLSKALEKVAEECAKACPTGALVLKGNADHGKPKASLATEARNDGNTEKEDNRR